MENLHINHLAVFVCAILNLALGALWYSPLLFYRAWLSETNLSQEQLARSNPAKLYGLTFLFALAISYNLAFFLGITDHAPLGRHGRFPGRLRLVHAHLCDHRLVRAAYVEVHFHQRRIHHGLLYTYRVYSWLVTVKTDLLSEGDDIMSSLDKAIQTQLDNIQKKTGKSLDELAAIIRKSGLPNMASSAIISNVSWGWVTAMRMPLCTRSCNPMDSACGSKSGDQVLDEIYSGPKAHMRPIHEKLMKEINKLGEFEIAPKKGYVSLRRKKQFVMIGPKTNTRFEVGINARDLKKNARLLEQPKGSMCNYIVNVTNAKEVDSELVAWIKSAYEGAG